jgi:feruloyl-CoA synthase
MNVASFQSSAPSFRKVGWLPRDIDVDRRSDGSIILKSRFALQPYAPHIPALFEQAVLQNPDRTWIAQRRGSVRDWLKLTYAQGKRLVDALTQALLDLKLPPGSPVGILSGNSIEHAVLALAAMQARLPVAPISPSYSLSSADLAKLKYVFDLIRPAVLFVQEGAQFDKALAALKLHGVPVIYVENRPTGFVGLKFDDLTATPITSAVNESIDAIAVDAVAKLLLTSGSTGLPKAVINTHRMMCANVAMSQQCRHRQPGQVLLDWLPWNHTMGGNMMFHSTIADRGTLYIDDGRPPPGRLDETLRNLKEISPSYFANVPIAYSALISAMENDDELARSFFKNIELLTYGGAALSDDLYVRIQQLAVRWTGHRIVFYTGWGSTETAPSAASTYWDNEEVGLVGLPHPGVELKLVPADDKYELRLRGVIVTPG